MTAKEALATVVVGLGLKLEKGFNGGGGLGGFEEEGREGVGRMK